MRQCVVCDLNKPIDEFRYKKRGKICESCFKQKSKENRRIYYLKNKKKELLQNKKYCQKNAESLAQKRKEYRKSNLESIKLRDKISKQKREDKIRENRRNYYIANRDKELEQNRAYMKENKAKIDKRRKEYNIKNREIINKKAKILAQTLHGRYNLWNFGAKRRGLVWNLTFDDISKIPLVCYYTGQKLTLESNKPNTVSLDRIDSNQGYTKDNVVFCSKQINIMKGTQNLKDFWKICGDIYFHLCSESVF